jgi:glycosyltransferase involved in cell wall biosynthesis
VTVAVSVIIPVHGDRGGLARTLACLDAQDFTGSVEILVVDNGDNPGLAATVAPYCAVRVLTEGRPGSYAARNRGIAEAHGSVLAFTDADCLPRPGWLSGGVRALTAAGPNSFVGGRIVIDPGPKPTAAALWDTVSGLRQQDYVQDGWAATANVFVHRETLARVGLFAAQLKSTGDREWGTRATAAGVHAVFAEDAVLDHPAREDLAEVRHKIRRTAQGTQEFRALRGLPPFDDGEIRRTLRPWTRWWFQRSRALESPWDRARYIAMAQTLQYGQLAARLAAEWARERAIPASPPT